VQEVGQTGAADGIQFGADERLYFTAIEKNAVTRLVHPYDPQEIIPNCEVETVIEGQEWKWPDSITRADDGSLYVATARIHLQGDPNKSPRGPFKLFRLRIGELGFF
jgi:sugar lactone lactonase YvrE